MKRFLPKNFSFSWWATGISVLLAASMLKLSAWQWERYHYKVGLLQSYQENSVSLPQALTKNAVAADNFSQFLHKKVAVTGEYDFQHQLLVANRRHASGPGYWLLTPFKLKDSEKYIVISRGFVPFADDTPERLRKYDFSPGQTTVEAVVQESVPHRSWIHPNSSLTTTTGPGIKWLYPDIEQMAAAFPYPVLRSIFLQRLGKSQTGTFPAESITVDVPPSTHFGYTIEWALLAFATLVAGFLLQAFPPRLWRMDSAPGSGQLNSSLNGNHGY